jgi:hypothetical protein
MSFYYDWYFEGETKEPLLRVTLYTPDEIEDIVRIAESTIVTEITKHVEEELGKKGYKARVIGAWPEVHMWYEEYPVGEMTYWNYHMKVKGKVRFETDRPLSESPIPAWLIPLLDTILKWVVVGLSVALAIYLLYEWIKNMTLQTTTIEEYKDGKLVSRTITTVPYLAGISGLIILLIIIFILVMLWRRRE